MFSLFFQGLVTFKDFNNMLYAAKNLEVGTMTFTLKEEEIYVRVTDGFKQIQVGKMVNQSVTIQKLLGDYRIWYYR